MPLSTSLVFGQLAAIHCARSAASAAPGGGRLLEVEARGIVHRVGGKRVAADPGTQGVDENTADLAQAGAAGSPGEDHLDVGARVGCRGRDCGLGDQARRGRQCRSHEDAQNLPRKHVSMLTDASREGLYRRSVAENSRPPVDPMLQTILEAVPFRLTAEGGVEAARRRFRDLPRRPCTQNCGWRTTTSTAQQVPSRCGFTGPTTPVRIGSRSPLYFHGGGFAVGDLDTHDATARQHAVEPTPWWCRSTTGWLRRLPTPPLSRDAWAATCWVAGHADRFGADGSRLAVAGDSAGGTLAAVVAQIARDSARTGNAGPRWLFNCCGTRQRCGTPHCHHSSKMPTRPYSIPQP